MQIGSKESFKKSFFEKNENLKEHLRITGSPMFVCNLGWDLRVLSVLRWILRDPRDSWVFLDVLMWSFLVFERILHLKKMNTCSLQVVIFFDIWQKIYNIKFFSCHQKCIKRHINSI